MILFTASPLQRERAILHFKEHITSPHHFSSLLLVSRKQTCTPLNVWANVPAYILESNTEYTCIWSNVSFCWCKDPKAARRPHVTISRRNRLVQGRTIWIDSSLDQSVHFAFQIRASETESYGTSISITSRSRYTKFVWRGPSLVDLSLTPIQYLLFIPHTQCSQRQRCFIAFY
jgi:hypothetical protein